MSALCSPWNGLDFGSENMYRKDFLACAISAVLSKNLKVMIYNHVSY